MDGQIGEAGCVGTDGHAETHRERCEGMEEQTRRDGGADKQTGQEAQGWIHRDRQMYREGCKGMDRQADGPECTGADGHIKGHRER